MAYRPVPQGPRVCVHCNTLYYAKDKRRIYCSSSCNTLAWLARKATQQIPKPKPVAGNESALALLDIDATTLGATGQSSLSTKDVAASAIGAALVAGANYFFNDLPAQNRMSTELDSLEQGIESFFRQMASGMQYQIDFINAFLLANPDLKPFMQEVRQRGEVEAANRQQKIDRIAALKAQGLAKRNR